MSIKIGDFVKGKPESDSKYTNTNSAMTRGVVVKTDSDTITVKILEHKDNETGKHVVDPQYFEVIGQAKPFNRDELLELLRNGCKKAILDYDLCGANLRDADIDFSCMPLKCGGLKWRISKRIACQLVYHVCSMQCDDEDFIKIKNFALGFANQFHRVNECGELMPIEESNSNEE